MDQTQSTERTQARKKNSRSGRLRQLWRGYWWALVFPALLLIGVCTAAYFGFQDGLRAREAARVAAELQSLDEQFERGIEDLLAGRYDLAQQRAEYILGINPEHEAAIGLLDLALEAMNLPTSTPLPPETATPAPPTPTPDFSSLQGILDSAKTAGENQDYDTAISLCLELRGRAPEFALAEVNDLLYAALRNRGFASILSSNLEQGIYDLTLAERFRPLDDQAASWRRSAAYYLYANSFVGLEWSQAYQSFADLCAAGIWDSCFKFALAAKNFGDELQEEDPCAALVPYEQSLITLPDEELAPTATDAAERCLTATAPLPTETATETLDVTATVTGTGTSDITRTPTPTGSPSATPTTETATDTPTPSPPVPSGTPPGS